jgi:LemA protein
MRNTLIILGVIAVVVIGSVIGIYNRIVTLNESITGAWSEIDNQLQRRNDLIPNLVNTVKGYATHEKALFENIAAARAKLAGAQTVKDKIEANREIDSALSRLLAIAENYPNLKANENFIRLQDELAGTENRVAVARQRYNNVVLEYNVAIVRLPGSIVARYAGFAKKDAYLKAEEAVKQVPKVQF